MAREKQLFLDTNALLNLGQKAFEENFVISQKTLQEIEDIKTSGKKDPEVKYKARNIARLLNRFEDCYTVIPTTKSVKQIIEEKELDETPDNIILAAAYSYSSEGKSIVVVSDDNNVRFISKKIFGLTTISVNDLNLLESDEEYLGYKDVTLSDEEMAEFYQETAIAGEPNKLRNIYGLIKNQYLIVRKSDGVVVGNYRGESEEYMIYSNYSTLDTKAMGKIKPINPQQTIAFNMLQDDSIPIKVIAGKAGSGKDFLQLSHALKKIETGEKKKLVYIRNPIEISGAKEIGFLPGSMEEKLLPHAMLLADHLGGREGLEMQLELGNIEIEHLGFIRGRSFEDTILYCSEAENLTKEHVQLLITRLSHGSELWMNGDYKQTDSPLFRQNNGMMAAIERLKGQAEFAYIKFDKTERSSAARLGDLLD